MAPGGLRQKELMWGSSKQRSKLAYAQLCKRCHILTGGAEDWRAEITKKCPQK